MQSPRQLRKRLQPHQEVQHHRLVRVVRPVVERSALVRRPAAPRLRRVRDLPVPPSEALRQPGVQSAHGLRQVAVFRRVFALHIIRRRAGIVGQDPREDRVLRQVVEGATGEEVEHEEEVKVGAAARAPERERVGGREGFGRVQFEGL